MNVKVIVYLVYNCLSFCVFLGQLFNDECKKRMIIRKCKCVLHYDVSDEDMNLSGGELYQMKIDH